MAAQLKSADSWPRDARERGAAVIVDVAAIEHNTRELLRYLAGPAIMAVVKADAYGHGLVASARAAIEGGATWLGVALPQEALVLRDSGLQAPILCWLSSPGRDWSAVLERDIDISISTHAALDEVAAAARERGVAARIHLKIDTGLSRNGCVPADWVGLVTSARDLRDAGVVEIVGIWSHLACADEPGHPANTAALRVFDAALASAASLGVVPRVRHLANSASVLTNPDTHYDMARIGIALYGLSAGVSTDVVDLRPAMTLRARLSQVKGMLAGSGISYGHTYVTSLDTQLGLVPLGYADGVPRAASNVGPVLCGDATLVVAGRVCMDQFVLDLGSGTSLVAGEEVTLFGVAPAPSADDWARVCDTIGYEIVTRIGPRVPRHYVRGAP